MIKRVSFLPSGWRRHALTDQDGYASGRDCDDNNGFVFPGQTEVCDGIDNDCDGFVDEGVSIQAFWDRDGDGFGDDAFVRRVCTLPEDGALVGGDCNDLDAETNPDAEEVCDGRDNDCDQNVDEDVQRSFFEDMDGDGHGVSNSEVFACEPGFGASEYDDDCDDTDPRRAPSLIEACDEIDNDCDGTIDEELPVLRQWVDADGDGAGDPNRPVLSCGPVTGIADNPNDCDDSNPDRGPHADEVRGNDIDEDCDGYLSEYAVPDEYPTLAEAIEVAKPGEVVQLGTGTVVETVDLRGKDITLAGEGCGNTVIYGDSKDTVVRMDGGRIERLTLSAGSADYGGALQLTDRVWVTDVCIENNEATHGGGIAVLGGIATLQNTSFTSNQAQYGGALYVGATAEVSVFNGHLKNNTATRYGGGMYISDAQTIVENVVFERNRAEQHGGGYYVYNQGAEYDADGTLIDEHAGIPHLEIKQSTFYGNWAKVLGQAGYNYRGSLSIRQSILSHHHAENSYNAQLLYEYYPEQESYSDLFLWDNEGSDRRLEYFPDARRLNPHFQSPETSDFRLSPFSPLIGVLIHVVNSDGTPGDPGAFGGPRAPEEFNQTYAADDDFDGLPTGFEWTHSFNPWVANASDDPDVDGLSNLDEYSLGTNPIQADTDNDGINDGEEQVNVPPIDPRDNTPVVTWPRDNGS